LAAYHLIRLFAVTIVYMDFASYKTKLMNVGEIDYDSVIEKANMVGYGVKERKLKPNSIEELSRRFGACRVDAIKFYYTNWTFFQICLPKENEHRSRVEYFTEIVHPYASRNLPPDDWIHNVLKLTFDLDDQTVDDCISKLKKQLGKELIPTVYVNGIPNVSKVYYYFKGKSDNVTFQPIDTSGVVVGGYELTFYGNASKIGSIVFTVPNAEITLHRGNATYIIKIDRLGGISLEIHLPPFGKIPKSEYKSVFKEMFAKLGLPQGVLDEVEFGYNPTIW